MATPTTLPASFTTGQVLTAAQMNNLRGAFRVLQVVSTTKTDSFSSATGTTPTDITGLSATITPSATSSQVLVVVTLDITSGLECYWRLVRGSTAIAIGDAAGSNRQRMTSGGYQANGYQMSMSKVTLDSPATTSATTYKVQGAIGGAGTFFVNRSSTDSDTVSFGRTVSSITVMEISA